MGVSKNSNHIHVNIKIRNSNLNMSVSKTSDHIQIKIKMPNSCQARPASSKAQNQDLEDMDVLCLLKIKIDLQNLENWCIKYQNQELKDMDVLCIFKIKIGSPKFGTWDYQWPMTISKSRSRCQTPVRNLQWPPKPQMRTKRTCMFFAPSKSR